MKPGEILYQHLDDVQRLADHYHIREIRIFGSVARHEDRETSDVDLLAFYAEEASILDHAAFTHQLKLLLGVDCDVLSDEILDKHGFEDMMEKSITLDDFAAGRYTSKGSVTQEERASSGDDNLSWILHRIADTIGDLSFEAFVQDPIRYDALAYEFQLLASIAENASAEQLDQASTQYGMDFSGLPVLSDMLSTTVYPRMLYQAAHQIYLHAKPSR